MGQLLSIPRWREEETSFDIQEAVAPPPYIEAEEIVKGSPIFDSFTGVEKRERPPTSAHPAFRDVKVEVRGEETRKIPPSSTPILTPIPKPQINKKHSLLFSTPPKITLSRIPEVDNITSKSTPQWRWNNQQCRSWLACVLIDYGGKSPKKAKQLASEFEGWGPNLYLKTWSQWCEWLDEDGQAIYALLMQEFDREGAVPKDVSIQHYVRG